MFYFPMSHDERAETEGGVVGPMMAYLRFIHCITVSLCSVYKIDYQSLFTESSTAMFPTHNA